MKTLPVFLRNNIVNEFFITNSDCKKLVLQQLVCNDSKTFDISRCVVYINDFPVNFIKGDWTNRNTFYINGFQKKLATQSIEPFSVVKLMLRVYCDDYIEKSIEETRFQLHLYLETEVETLSA